MRRALTLMKRPRDQFFAGPGLAVDEHGRIGRGHEVHLLQDAAQRRTVPHDLRETAVAAAGVCSVRCRCGR